MGSAPESAAYRGIRPSRWARLRRQAHLCGAHVVSNYAPLLDARLPGIQTHLDGLGSHARRRIQAAEVRLTTQAAWKRRPSATPDGPGRLAQTLHMSGLPRCAVFTGRRSEVLRGADQSSLVMMNKGAISMRSYFGRRRSVL